ncbi:hypothetical protein [Burkholderia cenocepacia]|uniref:hypothetical protein n=1 Tax=Burkholderia cenocepacia TaxID=95486 RepID=UPI00076170EE|nr:hypothetical protein [Burkholderia cenocepacia]KWU17916.1 hypothetical protein AS149_14670 [Burkholderia cenocepacia]
MRAFLVAVLALTAISANAATLEAKVEGLNCALCSAHLRETLRVATQSTAVEPRLDCGSIFLETNVSPAAAEAAISWPLTSNGFTLKAVSPSALSLDQVKGMKC